MADQFLPDFEEIEATFVLKAFDAAPVEIAGLKELALPTYDKQTFDVEQYHRYGITVASNAKKIGLLKSGGNYIIGADAGQKLIRQYWDAHTKIRDLWVWLDVEKTKLFALDLAKSPKGCFKVKQVSPGQVGRVGSLPFTFELTCEGVPAYYDIHYGGVGITFAQGDGTDDTILDAAGQFEAQGIKAGLSLMVCGHTTNKQKYAVIKQVASGVLTLDGEGIIETAAGEAATMLRIGQL